MITTILLCYALLVVTWVFYLAAMSLEPHLKTIRGVVKWHAYAVYLVGVVLDLALNWIVASALFWDFPASGEWLLTARLKRYHGPAYVGSKRAKAADWVCTNLLDTFDPDGDHC